MFRLTQFYKGNTEKCFKQKSSKLLIIKQLKELS